MFGSTKRGPAFSDQVETIIGRETQVKGTITASGTLRVDGEVEGEITTNGDVVVGETGRVRAQIKARSATVAGTINGNVDVADKLELTASAKVYGDIKTGILIIGEGAIFKGACEMRQGSEKGGDQVMLLKEGKAASAKS